MADEGSVVSAGIIDLVAKDGREELGKCHRAPQHDDDQREEPLKQVDLRVGLRDAKSDNGQQHRNDESRKTETARDEEVGEKCSRGTTGVLEFPLCIHPFARLQVEHEALVCLSRGEVADKRHDHVDSDNKQRKSEDSVENIVLEYIFEAYCLRKGFRRFRLLRLLFLCHYVDVV